MAQRSGVGKIEAGADREEGMVSTSSGVDALPIKEQPPPFALSIYHFLNFKLSVESSTQSQPLQDIFL
jgi:hypothetical protein